MQPTPARGMLLRHHKGGLYLVESSATLVTSGSSATTPVIVYRQLETGRLFARDADEFDETVSFMPDSDNTGFTVDVPRFEFVRCAGELL